MGVVELGQVLSQQMSQHSGWSGADEVHRTVLQNLLHLLSRQLLNKLTNIFAQGFLFCRVRGAILGFQLFTLLAQ